MSRILIFSLSVLILIFTSCKKEINEVNPALPESLNSTADSTSFILNGKIYQSTSFNSSSAGNKYPFINQKQDLNSDSIFFNRSYTAKIYNNSFVSAEFSFTKKFSRLSLEKHAFILFPSATDELKLFSLGEHKYVFDYDREMTLDGVAININTSEGTFKSYSPYEIKQATSINSKSHANSKFTITKLINRNNGKYLVEAIFETTLFDEKEHPVKLTKGFLRKTIDPQALIGL